VIVIGIADIVNKLRRRVEVVLVSELELELRYLVLIEKDLLESLMEGVVYRPYLRNAFGAA
jgi:hypothetical protein